MGVLIFSAHTIMNHLGHTHNFRSHCCMLLVPTLSLDPFILYILLKLPFSNANLIMLLPKIFTGAHKGLPDLAVGLYPVYAPGHQSIQSFQTCKTLSVRYLRALTMTFLCDNLISTVSN